MLNPEIALVLLHKCCTLWGWHNWSWGNSPAYSGASLMTTEQAGYPIISFDYFVLGLYSVLYTFIHSSSLNYPFTSLTFYTWWNFSLEWLTFIRSQTAWVWGEIIHEVYLLVKLIFFKCLHFIQVIEQFSASVITRKQKCSLF